MLLLVPKVCRVVEERVRVGGCRYRRAGQLCNKCAWSLLRPVNHTLSSTSTRTSELGHMSPCPSFLYDC